MPDAAQAAQKGWERVESWNCLHVLNPYNECLLNLDFSHPILVTPYSTHRAC